jgi:hypothetical protein
MTPTPDDAAKLEWTEEEQPAPVKCLRALWIVDRDHYDTHGPRPLRAAEAEDLARLGFVPAQSSPLQAALTIAEGHIDQLMSALRACVSALDNGSGLGESASVEECLGAVEIVREHVGHLTKELARQRERGSDYGRDLITICGYVSPGSAYADVRGYIIDKVKLWSRGEAGDQLALKSERDEARGRVAELEAERDYWKREHSLKCYDADHFQMMRDERDALASQLKEANAMGRKQAAMLRRADRTCSKMHMASASMIPGRLEAWANELSEALTLDTAEAAVEPSPQPTPPAAASRAEAVAHPAAEPVASSEFWERSKHKVVEYPPPPTAPVKPSADDDTQPRVPGCQCHWEVGDSPCRVHGDDEGKVEPVASEAKGCMHCNFCGGVLWHIGPVGWNCAKCGRHEKAPKEAPSAPVKPSADITWLDDRGATWTLLWQARHKGGMGEERKATPENLRERIGYVSNLPALDMKPSADGASEAMPGWVTAANRVYWKGYETANGTPPENHQTAHLCGVMAVLEYGIGRGRAKAGADVGEALAKFPRCQAVQCEAHARLRLRNLLNYCQEHADYLKSPDNRSLLEPVPWLDALEAAESLVKP